VSKVDDYSSIAKNNKGRAGNKVIKVMSGVLIFFDDGGEVDQLYFCGG
jgi:hypothetical protein